MSFSKLVSIIQGEQKAEPWKQCNQAAFHSLLERYYKTRAEKIVTLRAPEMRDESGVSYAAYINAANPDKGPYGGMSFVVFPNDEGEALAGMVVGTQGLAPDEAILGRPGHRNDLMQVLAYANLAQTSRVICCLVYPCTTETWESLHDRDRLFHQADLTQAGRPVQVWLTAVPMDARVDRITPPLIHKVLQAIR
jgi:hypothetical protein